MAEPFEGDRRTHYEVLGLEHDAGDREVEEAYRGKLESLKGTAGIAEEVDPDEAARILEAYRALSHPYSRAAYDARLDPARAVRSPEERDFRFADVEQSSPSMRGYHRFQISSGIVVALVILAVVVGIAILGVLGSSAGLVKLVWGALFVVVVAAVLGVLWAMRDMS